jgi:multidrug efflux pump subunit AcrB
MVKPAFGLPTDFFLPDIVLYFLLSRPVAVLMSFFVLILAGIIAFLSLPVSLLPDIDVPQIVVKINYPNTSPLQLEQNVLRPLRESLLTVAYLRDVQSEASSETGKITLWFEYGTQMDLAYIEVNEKIDRLTPSLPRDLLRPQVLRINTSDVPVARLQINNKAGEQGHLELSALVEKVLKI